MASSNNPAAGPTRRNTFEYICFYLSPPGRRADCPPGSCVLGHHAEAGGYFGLTQPALSEIGQREWLGCGVLADVESESEYRSHPDFHAAAIVESELVVASALGGRSSRRHIVGEHHASGGEGTDAGALIRRI